MEGEENRQKTKKEVMEEIISKSKFFKAQKAKDKEENEQFLEQLDNNFTSLVHSEALISLTDPTKMNVLKALVNKRTSNNNTKKDDVSSTPNKVSFQQLVGKDALAETDKITLETAKLLREDYLAQNAFTRYDKFCPFYKSVWMMRNIIHFYNLANQAVERGAGMDGQKISYILIKHRLGDLFYRLVSQKFEDPAEGEDVLVAKFKKLHEDLTSGFRNLEDETR